MTETATRYETLAQPYPVPVDALQADKGALKSHQLTLPGLGGE